MNILKNEKICPICKKNFLITPMWVYKLMINQKTEYFCSYTCYKKSVTKMKKKKRRYLK